MAALWTANEVVAATGGKCESLNWTANGVSIDSRTVAEGDLFIAIVGPENDGHAYVKSAFANGAAAAIVSSIPEDWADNDALVLVEDTQIAMEQLGQAARARVNAKIIAVTGSVGKTGTKEALGHILSKQGKTHFSVGSYNNHWGVPLSLSRMPADTEYAVFELGMNHPGEIEPLSKMVRADVGIITTIAAAHLEFFKNTAEIAEAKAEIFLGLGPNASALLNIDNEHYELLKKRAEEAGVKVVHSFGETEGAHCRLENVVLLPQSSDISANILGEKCDFTLSAPGAHWARNILAVLGAVKAVGADLQKAAADLATMPVPGGRGVQLNITKGDGEFVIIDESYNASPIAVQAALKVLQSAKTGDAGRKIVVLGDMRELGEASAEIHASLAKDVLASEADLVYACGPFMKHLFDALPKSLQSGYADASEGLIEPLVNVVEKDDVVLIKGSLGSNMKVILEALKAVDESPSSTAEAGD